MCKNANVSMCSSSFQLPSGYLKLELLFDSLILFCMFVFTKASLEYVCYFYGIFPKTFSSAMRCGKFPAFEIHAVL